MRRAKPESRVHGTGARTLWRRETGARAGADGFDLGRRGPEKNVLVAPVSLCHGSQAEKDFPAAPSLL